MSFTALDDPVIVCFIQKLRDLYVIKLELVVLFGSRAGDDACLDFDYDIAVFLHERENFGEEFGRLAEIETDILFDIGAVINTLPLRAGLYAKRTGFTSEIRRDGIDP